MRFTHIATNKILIAAVVAGVSFSSCKKFVELGAPPTQVERSEVFKSDATATSAVLALYSTSSNVPGLVLNFSVLPGLSADEMDRSVVDATYEEFRTNNITINNSLINNSVWAAAYGLVKNANNAIAGLTATTTLTPAVKSQLLGEVKTIRAFAYFQLVNLFGDVPLILNSDADYANASNMGRTPAADVWKQIVADLKEAQDGLPAAYAGSMRGRINKWAAAQLLARVYLFQKDYAKAEEEATKVIASGIYSLPAPANAFINTSNEVVWQLGNVTGVSTFGANYLAASGAPTYVLTNNLYAAFAANDLRRANWTGSVASGGKTYYFNNKYKVRVTSGNEYNIVLRYAEALLIRAEARAQQNNLAGARADADVVRTRAGLAGLSTTLTQAETLLAIEQERLLEFFGEWGMRWLDLKRTGRANAVLAPLKGATYQPTDLLYPIPDAQRVLNTNLTQNPGY